MTRILNETGIIVALDIENLNEACEISQKLTHAKGNFIIKIGRPLEMIHGIHTIGDIKDSTDLPIIYDGKIADIPYISSKIAEKAYKAGADAVIVHGCVGTDVVRAIVNLNMGDVIAVVSMSHPGWNRWGYDVKQMTRSMCEVGVNGLVLPATFPHLVQTARNISEEINNNTYIISPGVGSQGAKIGDAIQAGATYEIIGRTIYEYHNPVKMAEYYYNCVFEASKIQCDRR